MEPQAFVTSIATSSGAATPSALKPTGKRETFGPEELAVVMSNYDIGIIESVVEFPRGSRKSPKAIIAAEQGKYLLKRRAKGRDDPFKVAFCHAIQLHLASRQFPLPHLIGTRRENNSMLQWHGGVYELFEFIPGQSFPQTLEATADSGRVLGLYHKLLENFSTDWKPPHGSYHMMPAVDAGLRALPDIFSRSGITGPEIQPMIASLHDRYKQAADAVDAQGMEKWPKQIVHGDWHPGNMLYRDNHAVAVIDYDSARQLPRVLDVANGALQFAIVGGESDVTKWPDYLDEARYKNFLRGYDSVVQLSEAEIKTIPWLMTEALIAEAVFPIAATGQFGRVEGLAFLQMVQRKIGWIGKNAQRLVEMAGK